MTEDRVHAIVREAIVRTLPELADVDIDPSRSLQELGANSMDRMDLFLDLRDQLGSRIGLKELAAARSVTELEQLLTAPSGDSP